MSVMLSLTKDYGDYPHATLVENKADFEQDRGKDLSGTISQRHGKT